MAELYAGVMSGTSFDGVDAVVADFAPDSPRSCRLVGDGSIPLPSALRDELLALSVAGPDELARAARVANLLADLYAQAIGAALAAAGVAASAIVAAGVHGQTIRHRPAEGISIQLNNPARVAERTGVTVVADFRSRDLAAGGQGAPLVPAFHRAIFARAGIHRVVVNIGGIANLTDLPPSERVGGFDTGPGNLLLDQWHARHRGGRYDIDGAWSRSGKADLHLLDRLMRDPFFSAPPPKSSGRDRFNPDWLDAILAASGRTLAPADVQATLVALTARAIADAIRAHCDGVREVLVCGGGARNVELMDELRRALPAIPIESTDAIGIPVDRVEALAFAWLAREAVAGRPGNLPAVTGAAGLRVLGAIYPR